MAKRTVIQFHADGTVEHTRTPWFDTRFLGLLKVERMSEVIFDETCQAYYIKWLRGPYAGRVHVTNGTNHTIYFPTYEKAVEVEIAAANHLRQKGHSFQ